MEATVNKDIITALKKKLLAPYREGISTQEIQKRLNDYHQSSLHTILLVEDNEFIRTQTKWELEAEGYRVYEAPDAASVEVICQSREIDLILLDIHLPDGSGLSLISEIQNHTKAPIIIVSSQDSELDRVIGLEMGADDYVCKPVIMRELLARIKTNIRRYRSTNVTSQKKILRQESSSHIKFGQWILDSSKYQIYDEAGNSANLTTKEFQILEALIKAAGRVLSREHLFTLVHDEASNATDRAVDVQIVRIRKKIGDCAKSPKIIKTIRGIGYMFEDQYI